VSGKTCRKCGESKAPAEFPVNRRMGDGLSSWCRSCHVEATWRWRARKRMAEVGMRNYHHARCIVCHQPFSTHISAQVTCSEACKAEFAGWHQRVQGEGARG
jgi:hypothetical protein